MLHAENRLRILNEINQAILSVKPPERIAEEALARMDNLLPSQRTSVVVSSPDGPLRLLAVRAHGKLAQTATPAKTVAWGMAVGTDAFSTGTVHHIDDLERVPNPPPWAEALRAEGVRAHIAVPLRVRDQTIGALSLENVKPGAFNSEHVDMATQVAMSLAAALQSAQLYASAQQELADREAVERALRESEMQLRAKVKDLALRNRELDAFAHTVAHDLKAPLSLLVGYTGVIETDDFGDDPETLSRCVAAIRRSAHKMNSIVDELLLFASVCRADDVERSPVDMAPTISDVLWRLSNLVQQRQATITLPEIWPIAAGYAPWIEEVWASYLSNALKYGGDPPLIELGASVEEDTSKGDGAPLVRFWVRDNGNGLSLAQQERIFTPFERLSQVRVAGHGLGLSIVQRIMARLGGGCGVESTGKPGEGSTFYFTLPSTVSCHGHSEQDD